MNKTIEPEFYFDISTIVDQKEQMLACHQSKKSWLALSQSFDTYLKNKLSISEKDGTMFGIYKYAEG